MRCPHRHKNHLVRNIFTKEAWITMTKLLLADWQEVAGDTAENKLLLYRTINLALFTIYYTNICTKNIPTTYC